MVGSTETVHVFPGRTAVRALINPSRDSAAAAAVRAYAKIEDIRVARIDRHPLGEMPFPKLVGLTFAHVPGVSVGLANVSI